MFTTCFSIELAIGMEELLNALEADWHNDRKLFWNQPHNMLNIFEVDWLIDW